MKRAIFFLLSSLLALLLAAGCRSGSHEDPVLRLSADEALAQGKALLDSEKYYKARQLLTHAFEVEPNSRSGREALLLAADAHFLQGGVDNYIKCEAKYRDFINRFPTSDRSDYAQYQIGNCLARRIEKPDRDQKVTRQALAAFEELLRLYPTSTYVNEARQRIVEVTDQLAAHELAIARFYTSYGRGVLCQATIRRLEGLRQEFPNFNQMDEVLFWLAVAYQRCNRLEDATAAREQLEREHAQSTFIAELEKQQKKWKPAHG